MNRLPAESSRFRTPISRPTPSQTARTPKKNPKRPKQERYNEDSYRRAITRACHVAFPPPEPLRRIKVQGRKGLRWETDPEWRQRLGPEKWKQLVQWQHAHAWHPPPTAPQRGHASA
jgi:hypothetical protein